MSDFTTVEINGVKYEVKIDEARRIESFKVGDSVRLMEEQYDKSYKSYHGVIIGFDDFANFPNIQVATLEIGYNSATVKIVDINPSTEKTNKYRIAKAIDTELLIDKSEVLRLMDGEIEKKKVETRELENKRRYFTERFNAYFEKENA